jgi:membrane fusion protein (multidrug efflux system)
MQYRPVLQVAVSTIVLAVALTAVAQPPAPPPPEVHTIVTVRETVPVSFDFVGVTAASKVVEVRARVRGFLETRDFDEGARVEEGTQLFLIDQRPFEADLQIAKARVTQAETRLRLAQQEVDRLESVTVPGAIAESDLDQKLAERANAQAALSLAKAELEKAELELSYTTVEAPLTGYIGKAIRDLGSLVDESANSLLAEMQQVDPLYVSYRMSERDYLMWRNNRDSGEYVLDGREEPYLEITLLDGTTYAHPGDIDFEATAVDIDTGSVEMRATFPNPEFRLKPGQFVKARMRGYVRPGVVTVPQRAVSESPEGAYVYVLNQEDVAQRRVIEPGPWSGDNWIVESGLDAGERVIVEGLVKVQPGVTVNPSPLPAEKTMAKAE